MFSFTQRIIYLQRYHMYCLCQRNLLSGLFVKYLIQFVKQFLVTLMMLLKKRPLRRKLAAMHLGWIHLCESTLESTCDGLAFHNNRMKVSKRMDIGGQKSRALYIGQDCITL